MLVFAFLANRMWLFELLWQSHDVLVGICVTVHLLGIDFAHSTHTESQEIFILLSVVHLPAGANDSFNAKTPTETNPDCFSDVIPLQMISIQTLVPAKISLRIKRLNREWFAQHLLEAFARIYFS